MMSSKFKHHFSPRLISPVHDNSTLFIASEWQHDKTVPNAKYLVYRCSLFAIFFASWTASLVRQAQNKWLIYLTNWGYTLCTSQALFGLIIVLIAYIGKHGGKMKLQQFAISMYPVYWILNEIATPVAFGITVIYWTLIHNAEKAKVDVLNVLVHGTNSLLMMLELWVVAFPIRIMHVFYPVGFALLYSLFSIFYYLGGGTSRDGLSYIYPILRWDKPGTTVLVCLGVMVFIVLLHILSFFVCSLRMKLYQFLFCRQKDLIVKEPKCYVNEAMANENV